MPKTLPPSARASTPPPHYGRTGADITLVAATKMNDAARVREAVAAGIDACGENRVQEMTEKLAQGAYTGAPLHFIGHCKRTKVRQVVGKVDLIQSVDSPELLAMIEKRAAGQGIVQDILLEVNIGGEAAKSGVPPPPCRNCWKRPPAARIFASAA